MTYYDPKVFPQPALPPKYVSDDTKIFLSRDLPIMRAPEIMQLSDIGGPNAGGAYGAIKVKAGVDDRLWKMVRATPQHDILDMSFMIIKEAFIQHVLSNDPDQGSMVPKIYSLKKGKVGVEWRLYIEMERGGKSLATVMDHTVFPSPQPNGSTTWLTSFLPVCGYLSQALTALAYFNEKYKFTHRDLKMTNMIVSRDESHAQIVDFGMSCITINVNDVDYLIKAGMGYYHDTPCREQQDMGMLLMDLNNNYDLSDNYIKDFLDTAIPPSMQPNVVGTPMYTRRMRLANPLAYFASYNRRGTFYPSLPAEDQEALKITVVLDKLNTVGTRYMEEHANGAPTNGAPANGAPANGAPANATAGGRRKKTRKSTRRTKRRRK